jgi:hypothetical protein
VDSIERFEQIAEANTLSWWDQMKPANEMAGELAQRSLQRSECTAQRLTQS